MKEFVEKVRSEIELIVLASQQLGRINLLFEQTELIDRKTLSINKDIVVARRDLLRQDSCYHKVLRELHTRGITQKANELIDKHLTKVVIDRFDEERSSLQIRHLKVGLTRKSDQTKAAFQTDPGTKLTRLASDILSEGEQRALALAAFLTEVGLADGIGPLVIDDPVSSLDRERGLRFASRICAEAKERQVIVFTHDLVFFNDLCSAADKQGVVAETVAVFSDSESAGKVDPAGVSWKGLSVSKRLGRIRNDASPLRKMYKSSPSEYEIKIKHLYGRLRDTYERLVEECIFWDVLRRGVDRIETQKLRLVHLSDGLALRFYDGMTKANTYSHDNPASETVEIPSPEEFDGDMAFMEELIKDFKTESQITESRRPSMKPKKD